MGGADTIAALASAAGHAGIGVVRVSGPKAAAIMTGVTGRQLPARKACLCRFREASGEVIDEGIALYFPAPRSYTGEDILELQGHGGPAVLRLLIKRCLALGARLAEPGEFTRRAFLNDKLDLTQAEAVADLISANSEQAARSAVRSLQGEFSRHVSAMQANLTQVRALVEAGLDFPEEEIDPIHQVQVLVELKKLAARVATTLSTARQGSLLRDGVQIAIIGPPNAGKSSIINTLTKEDVAIVTATPGTTRDLIRQSLDIRGLPIHLVDTAGLREAKDHVEEIGITRTWGAIKQADIVLLVSDIASDQSSAIAEIRKDLPAGLRVIRVYNKIDLVSNEAHTAHGPDGDQVWMSAKTGGGVELLEDLIAKTAGWGTAAEGLFIARERHVRALERCSAHIETAMALCLQAELVAEEMREAQLALSQLTGEVAADDLLGEIFSKFCVGK